MAVIIIRIQVIELRRFGDTVCNSTRFRAFDGVNQDPCLAAHSKWADKEAELSIRTFPSVRKTLSCASWFRL